MLFRSFPAVALGFDAALRGGTACAAMNAANEVAVQAFLDRRLRFADIAGIAAEVMNAHAFVEHPTLDDAMHADRDARAAAEELVVRRSPS